MSMITATAWVPRGYPAQFPTKYDFDEAEFERISKLARLQLDDAKENLEEARQDADDSLEQEGSPNSSRNGSPDSELGGSRKCAWWTSTSG